MKTELVGKNFKSPEDFVAACDDLNGIVSLESCLARLYTIESMRGIYEADIPDEFKGRRRAHKHAELIADKVNVKDLIKADLDMVRNFVAVFTLAEKGLEKWKEDVQATYPDGWYAADLTRPPPRDFRLEHVSCTEEVNHFVGSIGRILNGPNNDTWSDAFYARVPIVLSVYWKARVVTIQLPATGLAAEDHENDNNMEIWARKRSESIMREIPRGRSGFAPPVRTIDIEKLTRALEDAGMDDHGWLVAPIERGKFDVSQSKLFPLRKVLAAVNEALVEQCKSNELVNPLEDITLYELLRAIKDASTMHRMALRGKLGDKTVMVVVSKQWGAGESHVLHLSSSADHSSIAKLVELTSSLRTKDYPSKYVLADILPKSKNTAIPEEPHA